MSGQKRARTSVGPEVGDPVADRLTANLERLRLTAVRERLAALLSEATRAKMSYIDFLDYVMKLEVESKQDKRVRMGMTIAHFPAVKTLEGFDFTAQPSLDERLMRELSTGRFTAHGENVLLLGPPGTGKTHLAIALGRKVVEAGYVVLFTSATALLATLSKAEAQGKLEEKLGYFAKPRLLIVDELGYLPFERRAAHLFFQLVSRRYERGSMIITTNQRVGEWGSVFGDEVVAAAILDRLLHHSHAVMIGGESYRLAEKRRSGLFRSGPPSGDSTTGSGSV